MKRLVFLSIKRILKSPPSRGRGLKRQPGRPWTRAIYSGVAPLAGAWIETSL